ncbi:MAG: TIM barrel protein [Paracoccaceae bacterium]
MSPRLSFNTFAIDDADAVDAVQLVREAGFDAVGLSAGHAADLTPEALDGLSVTGVFVAFVEDDTDVAPLMDQAHANFGAPLTILPAASAWADMADVFAMLERALDRSAHGRVLLEPLHPSLAPVSRLTSFAETAQGLAAFEARRPDLVGRIGLVLDIVHVPPEDLLALSDKTIARIEVVHLADYKGTFSSCDPNLRLPLGRGDLPVKSLLDYLVRCGFNGAWECETIAPLGSAHDTVARNAAGVRQFL